MDARLCKEAFSPFKVAMRLSLIFYWLLMWQVAIIEATGLRLLRLSFVPFLGGGKIGFLEDMGREGMVDCGQRVMGIGFFAIFSPLFARSPKIISTFVS